MSVCLLAAKISCAIIVMHLTTSLLLIRDCHLSCSDLPLVTHFHSLRLTLLSNFLFFNLLPSFLPSFRSFLPSFLLFVSSFFSLLPSFFLFVLCPPSFFLAFRPLSPFCHALLFNSSHPQLRSTWVMHCERTAGWMRLSTATEQHCS